MKKVLISITNREQNLYTIQYEGMIEDSAQRVIYHDVDGAVNEVRFIDEVLEIRRFTSDLKTFIYLSKDKSYAEIKTPKGDIDIPISLNEIAFSEEKISANYYTGENILMEISFVKEK